MNTYRTVLSIALVALFAAMPVFSAGEQEAAEEEGPMRISWLGQNPRGYTMVPDNMVELDMEEEFGVEIDIVQIDVYNSEQMGILFASGDIPDFIHNGSVQELYDLGVLRSIPRDWFDEYYPHIVQQVEELDDVGQAWDDVTIDGEIYAIPTVNITVGARPALATRRDWMEAVGIEVPAEEFEYARYSDGGWTLDDVEELLYAYRHDDPDGNGQKDTYGLGHGYDNSPALTVGKFSGILGAYNVRYGSWMEEDGELVWAHVTEAYKEALLKLADWYEMEIIDPEFVLDKRAELEQKYSNGLIGAYFGNNRWISTFRDTPVGLLLQNDPDAEPVYIFDIKGPDGTGSHPTWSRPSFGAKPKFGRGTSDEKVQMILRMLQWRHTNEDAYLFNFYGREGEHWDYDEDGFVVQRPEFGSNEAKAKLGLQAYHQNNLIDNFNVQLRLNADRYVPWYLGAQKQGLLDALYRPIASENQEQFNVYRSELSVLEQEFYYRGITGEIDIEAEWDEYVERWYSIGGAETTRWANEAQFGN